MPSSSSKSSSGREGRIFAGFSASKAGAPAGQAKLLHPVFARRASLSSSVNGCPRKSWSASSAASSNAARS